MCHTTPNQSLSVVFLDIDGVILPFGTDSSVRKKEKSCSSLFPDRTLHALNEIFKHSNTTISLVLSSTWRVRQDYCQQILDAFQTYNNTFQGILPGEFYGITNVDIHSERQWEIHEWLMEKEKLVNAWVCLDDEELLLEDKNALYRPIFEGHVVKTKSSVGLTLKDSWKALQLLEAQLARTYA